MQAVIIVAALLSSGAERLPMTLRPDLLAQSNDCSPRKTCAQISSCEEANWYLQNCSWGGRLDRDNDNLPCESGPC